MGYICTRCGGTNVACEAIVNPNTGKIIDYFDGSFMHAICSNCENEVIISNIEEVKHEIDLRFHEFVERTGKEPEYVECQIVRKETGDEQRKTIKLSLSINDDDNDDVFCYCNGIESFKQLAEYGVGGFIVTFCYMLFNLGIVDRWKRESEELIAELEKLCGKKWVNPYTPEKERFTLTLTDEERLLIEERIKAGYYSAENIEKCREETHKAKMLKKRAEICERYDKKIRQAEAEKKIMLCVFDYGVSTDNVIYYPHTNTLSFNWNNYGGKITQEEFDDFVNNVDRSQLPEGIKFELK